MTQQKQRVPKPPANFPKRTQETEQWYNQYYEYFWLNTELTFSKMEDTQAPFLLETLRKELDYGKISTVLEVGIGFGRIAKALLDDPDNVINLYDGIDISELAIKQSEIYLDEHIHRDKKGRKWTSHTGYDTMVGDFLELGICERYDLVISVETMTGLPTDELAQRHIDLMTKLSKKYIVNLDHHENTTSNIVFNNGRNYVDLYYNNKNVSVVKTFDIPNWENEKVYICRVK